MTPAQVAGWIFVALLVVCMLAAIIGVWIRKRGRQHQAELDQSAGVQLGHSLGEFVGNDAGHPTKNEAVGVYDCLWTHS